MNMTREKWLVALFWSYTIVVMFLTLSIVMILAGCIYRDIPGPTKTVVKTKIIQRTETCITMPPPPEPVVHCDGLPQQDCWDITEAAWSDYGRSANNYLTYYVVPQCTIDVSENQQGRE